MAYMWTQENILYLIATFRDNRFLWDSNQADYSDRYRRNEAWNTIANTIGCDVITVEKKLKSLKTHFMAVHKDYLKRKLKYGAAAAHRPRWFAYEPLIFLLTKGRAHHKTPKEIVKEHAPNNNQQTTSSSNHQAQSNALSHEVQNTRDECTIFGELVAVGLRSITDRRTRLIVQHQINNLLFEAQMGGQGMSGSTSDHELADEPSTSIGVEEIDDKSSIQRILQ